MKRFSRFLHQSVIPMGENGQLVTGSLMHQQLSKDIAVEGTVLLKNDGMLPLGVGHRICPFGSGFSDFLFGGGGSGWVVSKKMVSLGDALRNEKQLNVFLPLLEHYEATLESSAAKLTVEEQIRMEGLAQPAPIPQDLYQQAKEFGGTALLCISRYSTESNFFDRSCGVGDFLLWPEEQRLFDDLCRDFENILVVLNVCGPIAVGQFKSCSKVGAILYPMYGGGLAGEAICDIMVGRRYPSGHLQDTLAEHIEDYPSTNNYSQSADYVNYEEDIFVGYRYFETFSQKSVVYPFGYGLSYTNFDVKCVQSSIENNIVTVNVQVNNVGFAPGKEVIQIYLSAPQGKLGKASKILTAFQKTKELSPGEQSIIALTFDIRDFGSFDDLGIVAKSAFVLEKGEYTVSLGCNVRECQCCLRFELENDLICHQCCDYMAPSQLSRRLKADGSYEVLPKPPVHEHPARIFAITQEQETMKLADALQEKRIDKLLNSFSNAELGQLLYGHPTTNTSGTGGIGLPICWRDPDLQIPLVPTADGPAGFRTVGETGTYTTFFPCANVLSQTWDPNLALRMGAAGAVEIKENNGGIWLAPALNIHRNPMCGRNFEYYSEDPLCSGLFAAAFVKGVQSQNIAATIKHFCCNNKEANRRNSDSRVSQRALREIYLRGFEIVVKSEKPWALMTSYNLVNGTRSSSNWEALEGILREEWGYEGLIMTDWNVYSTIEEELRAGSNVKMPCAITESVSSFDFQKAIDTGKLTRPILISAAKRVFELMDRLE